MRAGSPPGVRSPQKAVDRSRSTTTRAMWPSSFRRARSAQRTATPGNETSARKFSAKRSIARSTRAASGPRGWGSGVCVARLILCLGAVSRSTPRALRSHACRTGSARLEAVGWIPRGPWPFGGFGRVTRLKSARPSMHRSRVLPRFSAVARSRSFPRDSLN